jgi:hypothetical protein
MDHDETFVIIELLLYFAKVPETYATSIERLMIILAENFPTIHQKQHFLAVKSLLWLLIALMPKGEVFSQVLSGFGKNEIFVMLF